ncbi:hypothetical protein [Pseudomonas nitroreducens]|uniref:hypothetical protein n=1 Tax=Pseudomonas nitroreducens TaxID=46680 RepID=UPI00265990B3|nr:hypothetical protein [Pseudomonas nitroreducens]MCP1652261.1 hypothetical protein [Pseudomonas nitroreducens]MCP1689771.1 hypothetical protein [Pseudomonas nitroreducens]
MPTPLTNIQFLALRSIAREAWDLRDRRITWRFGRRWFYLFGNGLRAPLTSATGDIGRYGYSAAFEQAWTAAWELEDLQLIEVHTNRCCPDTPCHLNDRHEFRLTVRGQALLMKANASIQGRPPTESTRANSRFSRLMPKLWARWWAARLMATVRCSSWLHAGNPTFNRWQRMKRNTLCLVIFLAPCKLPVHIHIIHATTTSSA